MERTGARVKVYSDRHICEIGAPPAAAAAGWSTRRSPTSAPGAGAGIAGGAGAAWARPGGTRPRGGYGAPGARRRSRRAEGTRRRSSVRRIAAAPQQAYGGYAAAPASGPALTGNTNLPPGWQELTSDGQVYYWNTETNVTQYERPA